MQPLILLCKLPIFPCYFPTSDACVWFWRSHTSFLIPNYCVVWHKTSILCCFISEFIWSRNSAVGMSQGYWLDGSGFECRQEQEIFLSSKTSGSALRPTQPRIQCVPAFIPEDKSAGAWINRTPPSSADINEGSYTYSPPICLRVVGGGGGVNLRLLFINHV